MGWRIRSFRCGNFLQDREGRSVPSPIRQYHSAVIRGEKLLDNEIEHGVLRWTSSIEIARLVLMRRIFSPVSPE
ncbi:MAG: hypothetical protein CL535_24985 [Ahrensia sp.]|nr:hypothetical protein [Ahrensia sp.]